MQFTSFSLIETVRISSLMTIMTCLSFTNNIRIADDLAMWEAGTSTVTIITKFSRNIPDHNRYVSPPEWKFEYDNKAPSPTAPVIKSQNIVTQRNIMKRGVWFVATVTWLGIAVTSYERYAVLNHKQPNCLFSSLLRLTITTNLPITVPLRRGSGYLPATKAQYGGKSFHIVTLPR